MADSATSTSPYTHIDVTPGGTTDPMLAAIMAGQGGGAFGGQNGLMTVLLLSLFGRGGRGGLFGGDGAYAGGGLADAAALQSVTSAKDAVAATNAAKDVLNANIESLSKQLCVSTHEITEAVNAITPQLFQSFAALTSTVNQGFATTGMTMCQNQAATIQAINGSTSALSAQAATNASAAALANCQTQNLIQQSTCDIRQHITADGALTRALIQSTETDRLRAELSDSKAREQTSIILARLGGTAVPTVR